MHSTAHPGLGDLLIQGPDLLVQAGRVQASGGESIPGGFGKLLPGFTAQGL